MEEKYIVNDVLKNMKYIIDEYENCIVSSMDIELRQTFQNIRNSMESFQHELKRLAETKGYSYIIEEASMEEIQKANLLFRI